MSHPIAAICLFGIVLVPPLSLTSLAQSPTPLADQEVQSDGPEEKPNNFAIYRGIQGRCAISIEKVGSYEKIREVLAAYEKLIGTSSQPLVWIASGDQAKAEALVPSKRDSLAVKNCYVYTKSLRCGTWSMQSKTRTAAEAEAIAKEIKQRNINTLVIYDLGDLPVPSTYGPLPLKSLRYVSPVDASPMR